MEIARVEQIIGNFKDKRIAVVGDLMLDVYVWGDASRISQEAPVPVVRVNKKTRCLGGAANVMRNIVTLGGTASAYGAVGDDSAGADLRKLLGEYSVDDSSVFLDSTRNTIEKQRVIASTQQLLRVDYDPDGDVAAEIRSKITSSLLDAIESGQVDAVLFEDYAKGLLDNDMVRVITEAANRNNVIVALDPHPSHRIDVKGLTLTTPNRAEAFSLSGVYHKDSAIPADQDRELMEVSLKLKEMWDPEYLLITLGPQGMALFRKDGELTTIATRAREVFDVSGAGDTVIVAFVLAMLGGADAVEAAEIANHAAGVVVGKVGTVTVSVEELIQSFREWS